MVQPEHFFGSSPRIATICPDGAQQIQRTEAEGLRALAAA